MITKFITRFAPSPTGYLHLGHIWSATRAFDLARVAGGRFVLRIEDIDQGRCRDEFVEAIFEDLVWLGLNWDDQPLFQSRRIAHYQATLDRLRDMGLVYPCWCTRAEIAASAGAPHGDQGPLYPGTCRGRPVPEDGRPMCWRLDSAKAAALAGPLHWEEASEGRIAVDPTVNGDVVIARKDVATSYHLAVVVDDDAQGITDIVRGQDLRSSTHIHCLLQAVLGLGAPHYHHHRLVIGGDGERLAKRRASPTVRSLREAGVDPALLMHDLRNGVFPIGFALTPD